MNARDAFSIFDKFQAEEITIFCEGLLFGLSFVLRGRVSKLSEDEVEITTLDGEATICLRLAADGLSFAYREVRNYPALSHLLQEYQTGMGLVIEFPDRGAMPRRERVICVEIPKP